MCWLWFCKAVVASLTWLPAVYRKSVYLYWLKLNLTDWLICNYVMVFPTILFILFFYYFCYEIDSVSLLFQPSINFRTFCVFKVCFFSTHHLQIMHFSSSYFNHGRPTCHFIEKFLVLVFSYSLISRAACRAFSFFQL